MASQNTLRKRILGLLHQETEIGTSDASMITRYGEKLKTKSVMLLAGYYTLRSLLMTDRELEQIPVSQRPDWKQRLNTLRKQCERVEKEICALFMDAIISRDDRAVTEIANSVKFLKDKQKPVDPIRDALLTLKYVTKHIWKVKSVTIGEVIEFLSKNGVIAGTPEDGYSQIRRICKELEIDIKPTRKTTRKKR